MAFHVHLARSRLRFDVEPGETVLAAGQRQGLALPFGCQSGTCASCRVRLLEGRVTYAAGPRALSQAERDAGYILMCQAQPQSDLELQLHQPERLEQLRPRTLPVRMKERRMLSHDVVGMWVTLPHGEPFDYLSGQYVDFLAADGRRRSFSIANPPGTGDTLEFHLRVTPQGWFAHYAQDEMQPRAILRIEGPLGAFYLREDSTRPVVMVAGGTGFAPIQAMLEHQFLSAPGALPRPFHLFWGARSRRDLYAHERVMAWTRAHPQLRYTPVLSEPDADWDGERGFVHETVLRMHPNLAGHEIYMAGPPVMVHAGKQAFVQAGLDADHLYYDSFDYAFETWPALG
ncbi:MAG: 2Fe-2S iron-sulfur cluster-binding protein [Nevskiaceae bacterium]